MALLDEKIIIGLTGMSGAGKTTVSKVFFENGFEVIDCDLLAREAVEPESFCLKEIVYEFGEDIVLADKSLNRKSLAKIVFSDQDRREKLSAIIFPYITYMVIEKMINSNSKYILLDAPTLYESGIDSICCKVLSVTADRAVALERIKSRDGISDEAAKKRLASQYDKSYYISRSDFCIDNSFSIENTIEAAKSLIKELK